MADLSGYPILRLDHIPLLDNAKLAETEVDAGNLLQELSLESPTPPLVFYLRRQLEAIRTEVSTRTAKERIQQILNGGDVNSGPTESAPIHAASIVTPRQGAPVAPAAAKREPLSTFKPLPLPTELARQRSLSAANENDTTPYVPSLLTSKSNANSSTNLFSSPAKAPAPLAASAAQSNPLTPAKLSSRSTESGLRRDNDDSSETSSYFSGGEGASPSRRRRPLSGVTSTAGAVGAASSAVSQAPSKQAQLVINQRFGSEFIVAATERRRRFYPKKQPTETPEEVKARERLERRKVAMQRLLERREKNQQELSKRKEQKRVQALKKQSPAQKASSADAAGDSEDESSESVSGGEAEGPVAVDPKLVEMVNQSDISQLTALVASKQQADASTAERDTATAAATSENKPESSSTRQSAGIGAIGKCTSSGGGTSGYEGSGRIGWGKESTSSSSYDVNSLSTKARLRANNAASPTSSLPVTSTAAGTIAAAPKEAVKSTKGSRRRDTTSPSPTSIEASTATTRKSAVAAAAAEGTTITHSGEGSRIAKTNNSQASSKTNSASATPASAAAAAVAEKPSTRITKQEREALEALASIQKAAREKDRSRSRTDSLTSAAASTAAATVASSVAVAVEAEVEAGVPTATEPSVSVETSTVAISAQGEVDTPTHDGVLEGELSTKNNAALMSLRALRAKKELAKQKSSGDLVDPGAAVDTAAAAAAAAEGAPAMERVSDVGDVVSLTTIDDSSSVVVDAAAKAALIDSIVLSDTSVDEIDSPLRFSNGVFAEMDEPIVDNKSEIERNESVDAGGAMAEDTKELPSLETSVAFNMDQLVSRSLLLVCESDGAGSQIIHSRRAAEALPGLAAWKQDKLSGVWILDFSYDMRAASAADRSGVFQSRASTRRTVSRGLLVLLLYCEDLLLLAEASEADLMQEWRDTIQSFDDLADSICQQDGRFLFESISVCGNCHAICKKLERLLRTCFVGDTLPDTHENEGVSAAPSRVGTARAALRLDSDSAPASPTRSPERPPTSKSAASQSRPVSAVAATVSSVIVSDSEAGDGGMTESASSLDILRAADMLEESIPRDLKVTAIAAGPSATPSAVAGAERATSGSREAASDSDREVATVAGQAAATSNGLSRQSSSRSEHTPSTSSIAAAAAGAATTLDPFALAVATAAPAAPTDLRKLKKSASSKVAANVSAGGAADASKPVSLSEFYPHIGLIFPVAYNLMDSSRGANDGLTARTLIESMQVQAKVYEEWMEVMSDYSTVFSEERNINENYGAEGSSAGSSAVYKGGSRSLHYRVKSSRSEVYNIVTDVFNNLMPGWEELPAGLGLGVSWNILWTWSKPRINMTHLLIWQKVNHFHDSKQLTRKDLLKKNLQRFTDMSLIAPAGLGTSTTGGSVLGGGTKISANSYSNSDFEIMPQTFILPHEYTQFVAAFTAVQMVKEAENLQNYWIMKPVGLSRGRGISLIKDLNELSYSQSSVVQRYIERPLCLSGYKFDLRLFVLVTSFKPLEAFIYRDGFARVSTHAYSLDPESMNNKFIHLTNSSIQKQNLEGPTKDNPLRGGVESAGTSSTASAGAAASAGGRRRKASNVSQQDTDEDEEGTGGERGGEIDNDAGGSKIGIQGSNGLWRRLEAGGINTAELWRSICTLVVKSLVVVDEKMVHQPCCFELFGYDVLVDADLRPWLLEVNASPSLARENALDTKVKNAMIRDIFHLLDPAPYDRAAVVRVLKRRLNSLAKNKYTMGRNDPDLERDLKDILGDYVPRRYGEVPKQMGGYEMLCPDTKIFTHVMKLKKRIIKSS